jgi:AraC family transcriptional regulator
MDNLKQTDIARSVAVSLSSLQKLFKHSLGYSINEYVMKRRMSEAATRLVLENAPVTDVAFEYGYNTVESFSRAFHKVYGVLPSEYKKDAKHGELFTAVDIFEDAVTRDCSRLVNVYEKVRTVMWSVSILLELFKSMIFQGTQEI